MRRLCAEPAFSFRQLLTILDSNIRCHSAAPRRLHCNRTIIAGTSSAGRCRHAPGSSCKSRETCARTNGAILGFRRAAGEVAFEAGSPGHGTISGSHFQVGRVVGGVRHHPSLVGHFSLPERLTKSEELSRVRLAFSWMAKPDRPWRTVMLSARSDVVPLERKPVLRSTSNAALWYLTASESKNTSVPQTANFSRSSPYDVLVVDSAVRIPTLRRAA